MKKKKKSEAGPAQHALSVQSNTSAKRGVKLEDAKSVTRAKCEPRAKHVIQQKHTLSLHRMLSVRSEHAKREVSC